MWTVEQSTTARKSDVAWLVFNGGRRYARGTNHDLQVLADKLNEIDQAKQSSKSKLRYILRDPWDALDPNWEA